MLLAYFFREIAKNTRIDYIDMDLINNFVKLAPKMRFTKIYHPGKNSLSKIILARVVDHPGKNLLSKMILARVVNFVVKSPGQERKFLTSKLLLKIVRI